MSGAWRTSTVDETVILQLSCFESVAPTSRWALKGTCWNFCLPSQSRLVDIAIVEGMPSKVVLVANLPENLERWMEGFYACACAVAVPRTSWAGVPGDFPALGLGVGRFEYVIPVFRLVVRCEEPAQDALSTGPCWAGLRRRFDLISDPVDAVSGVGRDDGCWRNCHDSGVETGEGEDRNVSLWA